MPCQTAVMNRAQDVAPQVPLTHAVGTILHHKSRKPYFLSDHPDQAVDVQPVCRGHAVNTGASGLCYNGDGTLLVSVSPKDGTLQVLFTFSGS